MTALVAAGSAFIGAGIAVGGGWGMFLIVVGEIVNCVAVVATVVKWWRRAPDRHRRIVWTVTVVYGAAWLAIRITAGSLAAWVLGFAAIGYVGTVTAVLMVTGRLAASHANAVQHAIASGKLKEIGR